MKSKNTNSAKKPRELLNEDYIEVLPTLKKDLLDEGYKIFVYQEVPEWDYSNSAGHYMVFKNVEEYFKDPVKDAKMVEDFTDYIMIDSKEGNEIMKNLSYGRATLAKSIKCRMTPEQFNDSRVRGFVGVELIDTLKKGFMLENVSKKPDIAFAHEFANLLQDYGYYDLRMAASHEQKIGKSDKPIYRIVRTSPKWFDGEEEIEQGGLYSEDGIRIILEFLKGNVEFVTDWEYKSNR